MQKLLIGYDGSPEAQAAIDDLTNACIPEPVEALVLSVADVWLPANGAAGGSDVHQPSDRPVTDPHSNVYAAAQAALEDSRVTAVQGAKQLALKFPDWRVTSDCMADSPGWALVAKARTWKAHLVVVGAHSRTIFERFFFGSTASKVAMEAPSSVRIARPRQRSHERKPRIILAVDGSRDSELAMHAVASRKWPLATEIRVLTVLNSKLETAMASPGSSRPTVPRLSQREPGAPGNAT
jgi:nucleotide-binding universal stress UspA family protein